MYKGHIEVGEISATFSSDYSNVDVDLLIVSYADSRGGDSREGHEAIQPGASGTVRVRAAGKGLLEVLVDTGHDDDSGRLRVEGNGSTRDDEPVQGPVRWVYTVIR